MYRMTWAEVSFWIIIGAAVAAFFLAIGMKECHADYWSGDDVGYGRGDPSMPCACAPGEDGIDWNGDGLSNSDDADAAPANLYSPGTAFGPTTPGSNNPANWGKEDASHGETSGGMERGHGSSDGGRGPDRVKP